MSLNPFFFRARFPTSMGIETDAVRVLIPFSSGQGFQRRPWIRASDTGGLNPFFFRARFPTATYRDASLALRLNPFFFRARFPTGWPHRPARRQGVLIPFSSGQGFQLDHPGSWVPVRVLIPFSSGQGFQPVSVILPSLSRS